jgi:rhodanese-related sulfurtransferase
MAVLMTKKKPKAIELVPTLKKYFQEKLAAELGPHDLKHLIDTGHTNLLILDVRSKDGYRQGHIPGAVHIPLDELPKRLRELPKEKEIVSYCWNVTCLLCTKASYFLASKGYLAREMIGGIDSWKNAGFPVET